MCPHSTTVGVSKIGGTVGCFRFTWKVAIKIVCVKEGEIVWMCV